MNDQQLLLLVVACSVIGASAVHFFLLREKKQRLSLRNRISLSTIPLRLNEAQQFNPNRDGTLLVPPGTEEPCLFFKLDLAEPLEDLQDLAVSLGASQVRRGEFDLTFRYCDYDFLIQEDTTADGCNFVGCGAWLFVQQADCPFQVLLRVADHFYESTCGECSMWQSRWHWADADDAILRERFKHVQGVRIIPEEYNIHEEYNGWDVSSRFTFGGIEFAVHGQWVYMSAVALNQTFVQFDVTAGKFKSITPIFRDIEERDDIRCLMQTLGAVLRADCIDSVGDGVFP